MLRLFFLPIVLCLVVEAVIAGPFEKAVMPGRLSQDHAKYESDCDNCHKSFDKSAQTGLCRKCHKKVNKDIKSRLGYHGRSSLVRKKSCRSCHTEHKGRKGNIILWDKETFNHRVTDFPLRGSHKGVKCNSCHKKPVRSTPENKTMKLKFREAPSRCYDCHKRDEPHQGKLGKDCSVCHRENRWSNFAFDHQKTQFPLVGKHQGVKCANCHPSERYKEAPQKCIGCHNLDDRHKGRYGKKCKNCHTPSGWYRIKFDHDKDTKFKLEDRHKNVSCDQCHKGKNIYEENLTNECHQCHRNDDVHKGRNGKKCQNCHNAKGFKKAKFDHDKTKFPLYGKHKKTACTDCHRSNLKDPVPKDCYGCHRQDDAHRGQQGKNCIQCHDEKGWNKNVVFDHDLFKFPLLGAHATLSCEQCHVSNSFKDTDSKCVSCHAEDDSHKKTLGAKCERCHNPSDWKSWRFDHNKQTKFKLDGAHKGLVCKACHRKPVKKKFNMDKDCFACHAADDAHEGNFGRFCDRCHITESFQKLKQQF